MAELGLTDLDKLLSLASSITYPLMSSLAINIDQAQCLNFLQLCSMRISVESWQEIGQALRKNKTIRILCLNAMGLNPKSMEILTHSLEKNRTVEALDLSFNYMGDECSNYITKLIAN